MNLFKSFYVRVLQYSKLLWINKHKCDVVSSLYNQLKTIFTPSNKKGMYLKIQKIYNKEKDFKWHKII